MCPRTLGSKSTYNFKNAVESTYQTLHDRLCPSSGLMDKVLSMIGENHFELVALDEVISLEDGEDHRPGATVDAYGTVRITSSKRNIAEPTTSEALRRRLRTWRTWPLSRQRRGILAVLGCEALRQMWRKIMPISCSEQRNA